MTITSEGRAQMAEAEARRAAAVDELKAERAAAAQAGECEVGDFVWSFQLNRGGIVVDADETSVVVLDVAAPDLIVSVKRRGARHMLSRLVGVLVRIPYADLSSVEPRTGRAMHEYARAAWASAGLGIGEVSAEDMALVEAGLTLVRTSGTVAA